MSPCLIKICKVIIFFRFFPTGPGDKITSLRFLIYFLHSKAILGGGALYNPDPNFSPSVTFPRSTSKSFFILIGLCPLLQTTTNVSVL